MRWRRGCGAANRAPLADAGPDRTVLPGALVSLDGTASSDADGDTLTYSWTLTPTGGSSASLSDPTSPTPIFTAWGGTEFDRATGIAIQPDGRIIVGGFVDTYKIAQYRHRFAVGRFR